MHLVIFIGDRPSKFNTDPNVAFAGSLSGKNLIKWTKKIGIENPYTMNSHTKDLINEIKFWNSVGFTIIALGNNASRRLNKIGIEHFKLPHPSPRNRKLNDNSFVDKELKKCKDYIQG